MKLPEGWVYDKDAAKLEGVEERIYNRPGMPALGIAVAKVGKKFRVVPGDLDVARYEWRGPYKTLKEAILVADTMIALDAVPEHWKD